MCFSPERDGWKKVPWVVAFGVNFAFFCIVKMFNNEEEPYITLTMAVNCGKPLTHVNSPYPQNNAVKRILLLSPS